MLTVTSPAPEADSDFVLVRRFAAPRELVWRAWTDPAMLARWMGPAGCAATVEHHDLRAGGHTLIRMEMGEMTLRARLGWRDVEPPALLAYEHSAGDADGNVVRMPFDGDWPLRLMTVVEFHDEGEATRLELRWWPIEASAAETAYFAGQHDSMRQGWGGSFDKLDGVLAR
ncbi:SRPBCC family protein [Sphingomonas sp. DT-204]|uniref:SRPBCC family protein n=1 Tax=Sphingomonas sp. DT-204 TaxID=3396166 RepID=UPI003F1E22E8